jgi:hypothetical protein
MPKRNIILESVIDALPKEKIMGRQGDFTGFELKPGMILTPDQKELLLKAVDDENIPTPVVILPDPMEVFGQ